MLDPTTETKCGNFGRYYPCSRALVLDALVGHGTMGLKCESTSYIITRVDATSFRSLFLIISTLVVGESRRLAPYQFGCNKFTTSVRDGARVRHGWTTGPGPAKMGEGLTGCDGGQQGWAGHGRVPAGPSKPDGQ